MSNSDEAVPAEEVTPEPESRSESELETGIWREAEAGATAGADSESAGTGSGDEGVERELDPMKVLAAERDEYDTILVGRRNLREAGLLVRERQR